MTIQLKSNPLGRLLFGSKTPRSTFDFHEMTPLPNVGMDVYGSSSPPLHTLIQLFLSLKGFKFSLGFLHVQFTPIEVPQPILWTHASQLHLRIISLSTHFFLYCGAFKTNQGHLNPLFLKFPQPILWTHAWIYLNFIWGSPHYPHTSSFAGRLSSQVRVIFRSTPHTRLFIFHTDFHKSWFYL